MKVKSNTSLGLLLVIVLFATIVSYGRSLRTFVAGEPYLLVACLAGLFFVLTSLALRLALKRGESMHAVWQWKVWSQISLIAAWQLLILALLNIWAALGVSKSLAVLVGSYLLTVGFTGFSDRLIVLAETSAQEGGSKPLSYFGRPRSRRVFFWSFVVFPEAIIAFLGIKMFFGMKAYPAAFNSPQLCLLLAAFSSAAAFIMLLQRYCRAAANRRVSMVIVLATILCLAMAGAAQLVITFSAYVYLLTTVTVVCIAASVYWLSRASMRDSVAPESSPESAAMGGQGLTNRSAPIGEI